MVERPIDEQSDFQPYHRTRAMLTPALDRLRGAFGGLLTRTVSARERSGMRAWLDQNGLPLAVSVLWILALGTYGIGYYVRMAAQKGGFLPSLDLMFFCFAVAGPVAMIWIVVALLRRSERLTSTIADQNETVLALATSVSTLAANVDAVSAGTTDRLDAACRRMEQDTIASAQKLDRTLEDVLSKIDSTLLDSVILLDRSTRDRTAHVEKLLENDRELLIKRLDADAETLAGRIDGILGGIDDRLGTSLTQALEDQRNRVEAATGKIEAALTALATEIEGASKNRADMLDESVRANIKTLNDAVGMATAMLESGLVQPVAKISKRLEETANSIAAHPPASADELARLLGDAASDMVRDERKMLAENVGRLGALEEKAQSLLKQIDRTSRLNPHMGPQVEMTAAPVAGQDISLPLGAMPAATPRGALNWTALVQILEGDLDRPGTRQVVEATLSDPDVADLAETGREILDGLMGEAIHVEDMHPEHVSASLWHWFGQGQRGDEIARLAGIDDDITFAILRALLRRDPAFRAQALRFSTAYIRLVVRASDQIGIDPRLIEMADTAYGRAFLLIAQVFGLFDKSAASPTG